MTLGQADQIQPLLTAGHPPMAGQKAAMPWLVAGGEGKRGRQSPPPRQQRLSSASLKRIHPRLLPM
jgi:hypothetical protein